MQLLCERTRHAADCCSATQLPLIEPLTFRTPNGQI
jgi:hypothetical protein